MVPSQEATNRTDILHFGCADSRLEICMQAVNATRLQSRHTCTFQVLSQHTPNVGWQQLNQNYKMLLLSPVNKLGAMCMEAMKAGELGPQLDHSSASPVGAACRMGLTVGLHVSLLHMVRWMHHRLPCCSC